MKDIICIIHIIRIYDTNIFIYVIYLVLILEAVRGYKSTSLCLQESPFFLPFFLFYASFQSFSGWVGVVPWSCPGNVSSFPLPVSSKEGARRSHTPGNPRWPRGGHGPPGAVGLVTERQCARPGDCPGSGPWDKSPED